MQLNTDAYASKLVCGEGASDITFDVAEGKKSGAAIPEISVIVPCYKEQPNVAPMVAKLDHALRDIAWEVIFVDDDSPDGTAEEARRLGA